MSHCFSFQENTSQQTDHSYKRSRHQIQVSRKVGCEAKISIKYTDQFPDFAVDVNAVKLKKAKSSMMNQLKENLNTAKPTTKIYVSLPMASSHTNHTVTSECGYANSIHPKLRAKVDELVRNGITNSALVRRVLKHYVRTDPDMTCNVEANEGDRAYYPTPKDIRNAIQRCMAQENISSNDQVNLDHYLKHYQLENPSASISYTTTENLDQEEECKKFMFVHQEEWQKDLLQRYGNHMAFLDATYKTSRFALPLFLLCVRTNCGYVPVAEFITEDETTDSITDALAVLKVWNPTWEPCHFMTDYSEAELKAIKEIFPSANLHICAFHREQAWERWAKESKYSYNVNYWYNTYD